MNADTLHHLTAALDDPARQPLIVRLVGFEQALAEARRQQAKARAALAVHDRQVEAMERHLAQFVNDNAG